MASDIPTLARGMAYAIALLSPISTIPSNPTDRQLLYDLRFDKIRLDKLPPLPPADSEAHAEDVKAIAASVFPDADDPIGDYAYHHERISTWLRLSRRYPERKWRRHVEEQGRWNPSTKPIPLSGPVTVPTLDAPITGELHRPLFAHLQADGAYMVHSGITASAPAIIATTEAMTDLLALKFQTGVIYQDRRLEMRKGTVGQTHMEDLLKSLVNNSFVKHLLLASNSIEAYACLEIAKFIYAQPQKIESWYLPSNVITHASLAILTDAMIKSTAITHIWLKRNPLGSRAHDVCGTLFTLITRTQNLKCLDLSHTQLGDECVTKLFKNLASLPCTIAKLEKLWLTSNGIGIKGAQAIGSYLSMAHCSITWLYLSGNPLGDRGIAALCHGLRSNPTMQHLGLRSTGMTCHGMSRLAQVLAEKPAFRSLDVAKHHCGEASNQAFNFLQNPSGEDICRLLSPPLMLESLKFCALGMDIDTLNTILKAAGQSKTLLDFQAVAPTRFDRSLHRDTLQLEQELEMQLDANLRSKYGPDMTYEEWVIKKQQWSMSGQHDGQEVCGIYTKETIWMAGQALRQEGESTDCEEVEAEREERY